MNERSDFVKIRVSLVLNTDSDLIFKDSDGKIRFSDEFLSRLYVYEEEFRSKLILPINEVVGLYNWAIKFIQYPSENPKFFVDIYVNDPNDYNKIVAIVSALLYNYNLSYFLRGTLQDYLTH